MSRLGALSRNEIDDLFRIIAQLKAEGRAICSSPTSLTRFSVWRTRWVCLRDGENVGDGMISGREATRAGEAHGGPANRPGFSQARNRNWRAGSGSERPVAIRRNLPIFPSRCTRVKFLGFYGLVGAGRSEAMQALFGMSPATSGEVKLNGKTFDDCLTGGCDCRRHFLCAGGQAGAGGGPAAWHSGKHNTCVPCISMRTMSFCREPVEWKITRRLGETASSAGGPLGTAA